MAKYGLFLKSGDGSILDPTKLAADKISFGYIRGEDRYQHDDPERSQFAAAFNSVGIPFGYWYCMDWWSGDISGLKQSIEIWGSIAKKGALPPVVCLFPSDVGTSYPSLPMPTVPKMMYELQACMDDLVMKYGLRLPFCATPGMIRSLGDLTQWGFILKSPLFIFNWNTDTPSISPWTRYLFQVFKGNVITASFTTGLGVIRFPYTDQEFTDYMLTGKLPTSDPVVVPPVVGSPSSSASASTSPSQAIPPDTNVEALLTAIYNDVHFMRELAERLARAGTQ